MRFLEGFILIIHLCLFITLCSSSLIETFKARLNLKVFTNRCSLSNRTRINFIRLNSLNKSRDVKAAVLLIWFLGIFLRVCNFQSLWDYSVVNFSACLSLNHVWTDILLLGNSCHDHVVAKNAHLAPINATTSLKYAGIKSTLRNFWCHLVHLLLLFWKYVGFRVGTTVRILKPFQVSAIIRVPLALGLDACSLNK